MSDVPTNHSVNEKGSSSIPSTCTSTTDEILGPSKHSFKSELSDDFDEKPQVEILLTSCPITKVNRKFDIVIS